MGFTEITSSDVYASSTGSALRAASGGAGSGNSSLTINDFFKLLSAQLENQDMYNTVDDSEFMAQMAQFSTLTQMQKLTSASETAYAVSLIGKTVNISVSGSDGAAAPVTGTVDKVGFANGTPYLYVNGKAYAAGSVLSVCSAKTPADGTTAEAGAST